MSFQELLLQHRDAWMFWGVVLVLSQEYSKYEALGPICQVVSPPYFQNVGNHKRIFSFSIGIAAVDDSY